ncbi:oligosaccharide flippase family protein [Chitinivibrio alkaliphilus]|nr:oligosaccharide flippase family protein [Chitinivibrio alkaliphilus]
MGLRQKTISALLWSTVERVGNQGIVFLVTLILARILVPEDFGLIGILMVFVRVSEALINNGFGQAIIQKKSVTDNDLMTTFVLSVGASLILYLILFVSAPFVADFYNEPLLFRLLQVMGFVIVLDAFVVIQRVQFEKNLDFKTISKATVSSSIVGGLGALLCAIIGFGVWSLVCMMVLQKIVLAVMLWLHSSWKPRGAVSRESFIWNIVALAT